MNIGRRQRRKEERRIQKGKNLIRRAPIVWEKRQIAGNADSCIFSAIMTARILKKDPRAGVVVIAQKGIAAETGLRIALEEIGFRLPNPHILKVHSGIYASELKGTDRNRKIEEGAKALAQHIRTLPLFSQLQGKRTIILVDDVSVGGGQFDFMERALEIAFPNAEIKPQILFSVRGPEVPKEIKFPDPEGKVIQYPNGMVYSYRPDMRAIMQNSALRQWKRALRTEIKEQLKTKKYVI